MASGKVVVLALAALVAGIGLHFAGVRTELPDGETVAAMQRFVRAQELLWEERNRRVDEETRRELAATDPLRTGLVGVEWSELTTTPGALAAKRTTTHPLWVAVFRNWFRQIRLRPGDVVAIGASGSFPGMVFAARFAAESMHLPTVMIGSLTASNYGANIPEMDLAEMDRVVREMGLLHDLPVAFTPGGEDDRGADLGRAFRAELIARVNELGPLGHIPEDLEASIAWRELSLLGTDTGSEGSTAAAVFVNIGGHSANYGIGAAPLALPSGLISEAGWHGMHIPEPGARGDSIAFRALRRGTPVVNILNIRGLAADHGIPCDPVRIPAPATIRMPTPLGLGHRVAAGVVSLFLLAWLAAWRVRPPGPREWFDLGRVRNGAGEVL